jgi:hypothetical protein
VLELRDGVEAELIDGRPVGSPRRDGRVRQGPLRDVPVGAGYAGPDVRGHRHSPVVSIFCERP